jgi:hypothetical protein
MTSRTRKRRTAAMVARSLLDFCAVASVFALTYAETHSILSAGIAGALVGAYGAWCFLDGITSGIDIGRRTAAME